MPYISLDGSRFFYQQEGKGPDVVLIHAVTSNLAVWMFTNMIGTLAADYRVTAYDLRGHGNSEATPTGYTSADMAADFRKLHGGLGLGPAFLVGHSFGGVIAMHVALLYPDLVAGVILSDSYFPGLAHIEPNMDQAFVWKELQETLQRSGAAIGERVDFTRLFRVVERLTPEQLERIKKDMGPSSVRWLSQLPRLAATSCGDDVLQAAGLTADRLIGIRQPVVALYDEHSPFMATCRYLEEHLPNCTIDIVPEAKHVAPLENPKAFIGLVRNHLHSMTHDESKGPRTKDACGSSPSS